MRTILFVVGVLLASFSSLRAESKPSEIVDFIKDITIRNIATTKPGIFCRWDEPIAVTVHGGTGEQVKMVEESIKDINNALGNSSKKLRYVGPNKKANAETYVFFAPQSEFAKLAVDYKFTHFDATPFFRSSRSSMQDTITEMHICIDPSQAEDNKKLHRRILQMLTKGIGMRGKSDFLFDGIFSDTYVQHGGNPALTDDEKKTIYFCMTQLKPGMNEKQIEALVMKNLSKLPSKK
jgi:hypothetical protein